MTSPRDRAAASDARAGLRLALLGGTGRTGSALIDAALRAGHSVVAPVRRPEALAPVRVCAWRLPTCGTRTRSPRS